MLAKYVNVVSLPKDLSLHNFIVKTEFLLMPANELAIPDGWFVYSLEKKVGLKTIRNDSQIFSLNSIIDFVVKVWASFL